MACNSANDLSSKSNLIVNFDISDNMSWNGNTGYTISSLSSWDGAKVKAQIINEFGLTAYDNGRTDIMYDTLSIKPSEPFKLYRVGGNVGSGQTLYNSYPMSGITLVNPTGDTIGNYFELSGGYLQNFFKLQEYEYELLPPRFNNGITIESLMRIDSGSSGQFFYFGTRAEDKYNKFFSGETKAFVDVEIDKVRSGVVGLTIQVAREISGYTGVFTSNDNYLHQYIYSDVKKQAFRLPEDSFENKPLPQPNDSINDSVFAVGIENKNIFLKRVDEKGFVTKQIIPKDINIEGWNIIGVSFTPYTVFDDEDDLICEPARLGDLKIYINGSLFYKVINYKEFYSKPLKNTKDLTIGVPYNISWGGGSFGLKHSFHYDYNNRELFTSGLTQQEILDNFIYMEYPIDEKNDCIKDDVVDVSQFPLIISGDNSTFSLWDDCDNVIGDLSTIKLNVSGNTTNEYYIEYFENQKILSNRIYDISTNIFIDDFFSGRTSSSIELIVYGSEDIEVIENNILYNNKLVKKVSMDKGEFKIIEGEYEYLDFESGLIIDGSTGNPIGIEDYNSYRTQESPSLNDYTITDRNQQWNHINLKFKLKDNTGLQNIKIGLLIKGDKINPNGALYIKEFNLNGQDKLVKDITKSNQIIENEFDSSYIGAIQKLRIYNKSLTSNELLNNSLYEIQNNSHNFKIRQGGRIIIR